MKHLTRRQSREIDRIAVERFGFCSLVLMENAGRGAADTLQRLQYVEPAGRVGIVCGKGNNGGDGFVLARHLTIRGFQATVALLADPAELIGDAKSNFEILSRLEGEIVLFQGFGADNRTQWDAFLRQSDVLVDALLGTGAVGLPREPYAEAIRTLNAARRATPTKRLVALDIPSGLDADSGIAADPTIAADLTLTFFSEKVGFARPEAVAYLGDVVVQDIGVPASCPAFCSGCASEHEV